MVIRFPHVDIDIFEEIYAGTFKPEHLTKLSRNNIYSEDDGQEYNGIIHLLQCFEVYGQAIYYFAHPNIALELQQALSKHRICISEMSPYHTFDSIRKYNASFMTARMKYGQDDPDAWSHRDMECEALLVPKYLAGDGSQMPTQCYDQEDEESYF